MLHCVGQGTGAHLSRRDDFSEPVKRRLALRAAHRCSNPDCRHFTIKPNDSGGAISSGVAAHICAAAVGGPRHDASQAPEERAAQSNGIWLCHTCSDFVDKDSSKYPVELLRGWRTQHEQWVTNEDLLPKLPRLLVTTVQGFTLPEQPAHLALDELKDLREHKIVLGTSSRHELEQVRIRVQFPEPVAKCGALNVPPGIGVNVRPDRPNFVFSGTGGASVTVTAPPRPIPNFVIEVERLLPGRDVVLRLWSTLEQLPGGLAGPKIDHGDALVTYALGEFLYREGGQIFPRRFIVPLASDSERNVTSAASEEEVGARRLIQSMVWA